MEQANIALEYFGIAVSVLLLVCCFIEKTKMNKQTKLFIAMLFVNAFVLFFDALTWQLAEQASLEGLLYALNFMVYSLGYVMTALFTCYLVNYISEKVRLQKNYLIIICGLCIIAILLVVVSLFNNIYFSYENGIYLRGKLYWFSQAYPVGIMAVNMIVIIKNSKSLGLHDTLSFLSYGLLPIIATIVQIVTYGITLLYLATTLSLLVIYLMVHVEQNRRMARQEVELSKANVAVMLSQIQPHFLYNSLSVIQVLCDTDPEMASKAVVEFADFLRGNMDSLTQEKLISFEQELNQTNHYLALEKLRFKERVNIIFDIQSTLFRVPTLTLQTIVENAVRHGITKKEEGGTVKISSRETAKAYVVTVEDDGVGYYAEQNRDDGRSHIGIVNVTSRLKDMCNGSVSVESVLGEGTKVTIEIPKYMEKEG